VDVRQLTAIRSIRLRCGVDRHVPIAEVVEGALAVHRDAVGTRLRTGGPNVPLAAKPALSLALALHELAINAAKYGALSNTEGMVDLRWHVVHEGDAPRFCLTWSEHGGPPIQTQPTRRGFGSRLIERSFAAEVGGEVKLTYAPTGLTCRLEAPLASMQEVREEAAAGGSHSGGLRQPSTVGPGAGVSALLHRAPA
jgi:two-component sensor histidine kinase